MSAPKIKWLIMAISIGSFGFACSENSTEPEAFPDISRIDYYAVWSEINSSIAYIHDHPFNVIDPDSSGVYIIKEDGSDKISFYPSQLTYSLDWSKDGQWILINSYRRLIKINYYTNEIDTLSEYGEYWEASWSPNGDKIVFSKRSGSESGIYVMNSDGSDPKRIIAYGDFGSWPYADSLIYLNHDSDFPSGTIIMADTTGQYKRLLFQPPSNFISSTTKLKLHIADRKIVFHTQVSGEPESIWKYTEGSNGAVLLKKFSVYPEFSPDGSKIVFMNMEASNGRLWIINWDGTGIRQLTF